MGDWAASDRRAEFHRRIPRPGDQDRRPRKSPRRHRAPQGTAHRPHLRCGDGQDRRAGGGRVIRVPVKPELLRWARGRSGWSAEGLAGKFPRLEAWERGESHPTLKQLEQYAKVTSTPIGYLFLQEPPVERVPIPDFRTMGGASARPSPDLLETIYLCQQRQEWYRGFALAMREEPIGLVGSAQ